MARGARSAPRRNKHPAVGRIRLHLCKPAAGARPRSARDAGAGATERAYRADLRRHRPQPDSRAAAVRHRRLARSEADRRAGQPVGVALSGRLPPRRPVPCRRLRLRRGVLARTRRRRRHAVADVREAGRGADHRLAPDLRPRRSARRQGRAGQSRWRRNFRTCAASSGKAMCATPSPASACPMWCRSSASTRRRARAGSPAARPTRSPSVS